MKISETIDARKEKLDAKKAWDILAEASSIAIAKGKKELRFAPSAENHPDILKAAMGPSGNLRAPTLRIADNFLVGFNPELYHSYLLE